MANPSCGRFANPPTSQKFPKKKKKKPNPNPIMHHLLLSLLHHLCKSYNHKKKHFHLPHQHDAIDGDHLFMSIIKEEGNHPSEERGRRRRRRTRSFSPKSLYFLLSFSLSLSHTKSILRVIVVNKLLHLWLSIHYLNVFFSAPFLDSQVFSILSHTLHSCFCSQNSQPLLYFLLLHLHLL